MIGNADTLRNASNRKGKALWKGVLDQLAQSDAIQHGLPVVCQCGRDTRVRRLCTPADFFRMSPFGGCDLPCNQVITSCPHGHLCHRPFCHPPFKANAHANILCQTIMPEKCSDGHPVGRVCSSDVQNRCLVVVRDDCPKGHIHTRHCGENVRKECHICNEIEKVKEIERTRLLVEGKARAKGLVKSQMRVVKANSTFAAEQSRAKEEALRIRAEREAELLEERVRKMKMESDELLFSPPAEQWRAAEQDDKTLSIAALDSAAASSAGDGEWHGPHKPTRTMRPRALALRPFIDVEASRMNFIPTLLTPTAEGNLSQKILLKRLGEMSPTN